MLKGDAWARPVMVGCFAVEHKWEQSEMHLAGRCCSVGPRRGMSHSTQATRVAGGEGRPERKA